MNFFILKISKNLFGIFFQFHNNFLAVCKSYQVINMYKYLYLYIKPISNKKISKPGAVDLGHI